MRILVCSYEWPGVTENCGGGGRIGTELVDGLRERGHEVRVVSDPDDGHYMTFSARRYGAIKRAVEAFDPDVLHGLFSVPSSLPLARCSTTHDVPLVVSVMGADVYDPTRYSVLKIPRYVANQYVFRRADVVAVPSQDMSQRLPAVASRRARLIHYGIDPTDWRRGDPDAHDPLRVLTVARLVERKNLKAGIMAVKRLNRHATQATYDIVGTGPRAMALRNGSGMPDWLTFRGYVEDIEAAYADADVFLLPSRHEAFGIVGLEALASGCPLVFSDTGGHADMLRSPPVANPPGVLVEKPTPNTLATALDRVQTQYDQYQAATNGYVKEHFSRAQMVSAYEDAYRDALDSATTEEPIRA